MFWYSGILGRGRVTLLTALAQELVVLRERRMHFTTCAKLMEGLMAAKRDLRLSREIKRLARFEGLIIDDLGYILHQPVDGRRRHHRVFEDPFPFRKRQV